MSYTLYPCTCSRKEIASVASAPADADGELVYPGTCRNGPRHPERAPAWRFRMDTLPSFVDGVMGEVTTGAAGDFVVTRADGVFAYQLAVVVDDRDMGITEVVRGQDLLGSTPRQLALFAALGATAPRYFHVPLVLDASGERLGKRHGSTAIARLREAGRAPEAIVAQLALSLGQDVGETLSARALLDRFEAARIGTAPTRLAP
jgi:glutamyl-tRNA synthetase